MFCWVSLTAYSSEKNLTPKGLNLPGSFILTHAPVCYWCWSQVGIKLKIMLQLHLTYELTFLRQKRTAWWQFYGEVFICFISGNDYYRWDLSFSSHPAWSCLSSGITSDQISLLCYRRINISWQNDTMFRSQGDFMFMLQEGQNIPSLSHKQWYCNFLKQNNWNVTHLLYIKH